MPSQVGSIVATYSPGAARTGRAPRSAASGDQRTRVLATQVDGDVAQRQASSRRTARARGENVVASNVASGGPGRSWSQRLPDPRLCVSRNPGLGELQARHPAAASRSTSVAQPRAARPGLWGAGPCRSRTPPLPSPPRSPTGPRPRQHHVHRRRVGRSGSSARTTSPPGARSSPAASLSSACAAMRPPLATARCAGRAQRRSAASLSSPRVAGSSAGRRRALASRRRRRPAQLGISERAALRIFCRLRRGAASRTRKRRPARSNTGKTTSFSSWQSCTSGRVRRSFLV